MSKNSHRRYLERNGFRKPKDNSFSKSEAGVRYEYNDRIWNKFTRWSTKQRDAGIAPTFKDFYNELTPENQEQIIVTQIFKDETEKTNCR